MEIGIVFCGGCNPEYDRVLCKEEMMKLHPNLHFEPAIPQKAYQYLLVFCGCRTRCADLSRLTGTPLYISAEDEFLQVHHFLTTKTHFNLSAPTQVH